MIETYEGRLGGGKTYAACVRIVEHLARGGVVCTNIEIIWEAVAAYVAKKWRVVLEASQLIVLSDEQIPEFHRHTPSGTKELPVLVVVDEAHLVFNARDWAKTSKETLSFLTQSRKVSTDIIFISQSALNIDKQFARLVQFIWRFRDLSVMKIPGLGCKYPFQHMMITQFDYDGKTRLQRYVRAKDTDIFKLYNTNSLLREFPRLQGVNSKRELAKVEREKTPMWKLLIFVAVIGIIVTVVFWNKIQNFGKPDKAPEAARELAPAIAAQKVDPIAHADSKRAQASVTEKKEVKAETLYDIYDEQFRSSNGYDNSLTTDSGVYAVGEMSPRGFVIAVRTGAAKVARVVQNDGRAGWIVAREKVTFVKKNEDGSEMRKDVVAAAPVAAVVPPAPPPVTPPPIPATMTKLDSEGKEVAASKPPVPRFRGIDIRQWPKQIK